VRQILVNDWPNRSHVDLLETCVSDLLMFIFRASDNVVSAKVSVCKPDIFPEVEAVGVEAQWTRADFERLSVKA
jgi:dihydroneopterin aldolase